MQLKKVKRPLGENGKDTNLTSIVAVYVLQNLPCYAKYNPMPMVHFVFFKTIFLLLFFF